MKKLILSALCACAMIFSSVASAAAPILDQVIARGELRVGLTGDQPPFNATTRDGQLMGFDVDLARAFASAMQLELKIVDMPFGELQKAIEQKKVDMVISGMAITPSRSLDMAFIGPYMMSGKSILAKSKTLDRLPNTADFNSPNVRVAALEKSTSMTFAERYLPNSKLGTVENYDEAIQQLLNDKIDIMVADLPICKLALLRHPGKGLTTMKRPLTVEPIGIAMSLEDPQFVQLADNYLETFEKMGLLTELKDKWFDNGEWVASLR
ncbi:transporter substrate-binding domain-containing protein [Echinimonas agarilytica]|uniref:Transporter substrate-binding domain-containing protein n=1 Tax=Echinimonas agarilytica TaxID=1215918 RepID=A0AA42B855_9GAMM|nr:transporter substrate-binding domain-containing protein [Echinimonas agarilytica]MCM2680514.1 transporter substrate-binding domain-containing protein [Echinimonas agarilytica]